MRRGLLLVLTLMFPWTRFKFNQWGARSEFNIQVVHKRFTHKDVQVATVVLWKALNNYRDLLCILESLASLPESKEHTLLLEKARQDLDDAAHRYRSLLRLARYFRPDCFEQMPEVQSSRQVLRALRHRPLMPMGFAD